MATVNIEIDGQPIEAEAGSRVIQVADDHGIAIPRFCYHKKLSAPANCRMCLVEVEKARKPLPACATLVAEGMKVFTKTKFVRDAQQAVMEFLLINHPLDCPICDQGGECELQDVAVGYGQEVSQYSEAKRAVDNEDLGPLIATEMTRCIHCTRCVRFGKEVAGLREMGATGRGEHTQIGTYVKHTVSHELSANIIDLCPVGALTSKPFQFQARAWELTQLPNVASHDCLGSNTFVHTRRGQVMRIVPRDNESINETWLADRDRFSYLGASSTDRIAEPRVKINGEWQNVDWQTALNFVVEGLEKIKAVHGGQALGALASPSATTEEFYLLQQLMRTLECSNIDCRLQQRDFNDDAQSWPVLLSTAKLNELDCSDAVLVLGSDMRREQPIAAHRLRKAALAGAKVAFINSVDYDFNFDAFAKTITTPNAYLQHLQAIASLLAETSVEKFEFNALTVTKSDKLMAATLTAAEKPIIVLGLQALHHEVGAQLRYWAEVVARLSGAKILWLSQGANQVGAAIAGAMPGFKEGGLALNATGLNARQMVEARLPAYLLLNVEPEFDHADSPNMVAALAEADFVVSLAAFESESVNECAQVILPIATCFETSGTFVNTCGTWQSMQGVVAPYAEARPAWKVLRVLANLCGRDDLVYETSADVLKVLQACLKPGWEDRLPQRAQPQCSEVAAVKAEIEHLKEYPLYRIDALVRRTQALQGFSDQAAQVRLHSSTAERLALKAGQNIAVPGGEALQCVIDDAVAPGVAVTQACVKQTVGLMADNFAELG